MTKEMAENEVRNWFQLNHPNIVKVSTWFVDRGVLHIIMEYVDGITMKSLIEDHQKKIIFHLI